MGATSIFVSTFVSPLHLIVQTYFIISSAFQTKMGPSNLENSEEYWYLMLKKFVFLKGFR